VETEIATEEYGDPQHCDEAHERDPEGVQNVELVETPDQVVVAQTPLVFAHQAEMGGREKRQKEQPDDDGERRQGDDQTGKPR